MYFAPDERSAAAVNRYLQSDTGSEAEALALAELPTAAEIAPQWARKPTDRFLLGG